MLAEKSDDYKRVKHFSRKPTKTENRFHKVTLRKDERKLPPRIPHNSTDIEAVGDGS